MLARRGTQFVSIRLSIGKRFQQTPQRHGRLKTQHFDDVIFSALAIWNQRSCSERLIKFGAISFQEYVSE